MEGADRSKEKGQRAGSVSYHHLPCSEHLPRARESLWGKKRKGKREVTTMVPLPTKTEEDSLGWLELLTGFTFYPSYWGVGEWDKKNLLDIDFSGQREVERWDAIANPGPQNQYCLSTPDKVGPLNQSASWFIKQEQFENQGHSFCHPQGRIPITVAERERAVTIFTT